MAINYQRLGRSAAAFHATFWTLAVTMVVCTIGFILPATNDIPNSYFLVPQIFAMYGLAKSYQGPVIEKHRKAGGAMASAWGAAGLSILISFFLLAVIFGIAWLQPE
jgi:hypothetical protein